MSRTVVGKYRDSLGCMIWSPKSWMITIVAVFNYQAGLEPPMREETSVNPKGFRKGGCPIDLT